ncbi:histidine phosphatase family protein [Roseococcus sp. SDR]|uniref:histidine phosphatase family protein n=1 Tax=Roseococcus sp. SDR TaxID=2835532 RepID=UPI001BCC29DF|nr:histidine phosphatase family protein [Roseococcus sp. SDR]MBS7790591.1 histidine phosphatase family protein [Roseococcus sp. SDR]MBV1845905.1 histidine phosphatase family protein [Roseococcus sp. SDR]
MSTTRRALLGLTLAAPAAAQQMVPGEVDGSALLPRLRAGGLVLFFRHADTAGEPCDRSYRLGDRAGQRNLSPRGRAQARRIGQRFAELGIPVQFPVLAGPVYRARDTAEEAWGSARVQVTDSLLADDYAGARLDWVLAEHRRLFNAPLPAGVNRVLVGHRTPAIMIYGQSVGGTAFPEGAALVIEPGAAQPLGIVEFVKLPGGGFHGC